MASLFSGKVTNAKGETKEFENWTEEEIRQNADIRNPDVSWAKYHEVITTDDD